MSDDIIVVWYAVVDIYEVALQQYKNHELRMWIVNYVIYFMIY